jgi:putative transposase
MKTYKLKLYHSKKNKKLEHQLWIASKVYNHSIAFHKRYWKLFHKSLNKYKLSTHLTKIKKLPKYSYWQEIPSHAIQNIVDRIDKGYKLFWGNLKRKKKTAPPKFKSWRKYRSFSYNCVGQRIVKENTIKIAGNKYKFFKSREIEGRIKLLTVKRDACGDFYVYLVCETPEIQIETRLGESIGFDFGFKGKMLVADDAENDISTPEFFKKQKNIIAKASRKLSSKRARSNNRRKARLELARFYRKITNQRNAFHWLLARELCSKYSILCFEDLNMKFMQKHHGKKVMDYGFAEFLNILEYVAQQFNTKVVRVDKFYPSSQLCHECGYKNSEVKALSIREWTCPNCGHYHDRDRNAAKNIRSEGLRILNSVV